MGDIVPAAIYPTLPVPLMVIVLGMWVTSIEAVVRTQPSNRAVALHIAKMVGVSHEPSFVEAKVVPIHHVKS